MILGNLTLILGGSRSGKSEFAEKLAMTQGDVVCYLATGVVTDEEMGERVAQHQRRRPIHWQNIEEPLRLEQAVETLKNQQGVLLIDSLSGWMANLLYEDNLENWQWGEAQEKKALDLVNNFLDKLQGKSLNVLMVGDEVGMGLVPPTAEGRAFRDLNGKANQLVANRADEVYFIIAGQPLKIK